MFVLTLEYFLFFRHAFWISVCNFIKKETLEQVFSCEFCQISKNTFLHGTPLVSASVYLKKMSTLFVENSYLVR